MSLEPRKIIATINADGSECSIQVKGAKGKKCLELTQDLEKALGEVGERKLTEEYHQHVTGESHQSIRG